MANVRIFLSSTFSDFKDERLEVIEVFRRMRSIGQLDVDLITMEDFGFSDSRPLEKCLELVESADAYLGLLGQRYGSMPPGGKLSYTEREYRHAHRLRKPIFILERTGRVLASEIEIDGDKLEKLQKLKAHARDNHLVLGFESSEELGKSLAQYLPSELGKIFPAERIKLGTAETLLVPFFKLGNRQSPLTQERKDASTLEVLAMSAIGFLRERATIEAYIKGGCQIRIIIVKRGGLACQLIVANKGGNHLTNDLDQAISRGHDLSQRTKGMRGSIELRELDWVPPSSLFLFDSGLPTAIGWVAQYTPDISTSASEKWVVELSSHRGSEALEFYSTQFQQLWTKSTPSW